MPSNPASDNQGAYPHVVDLRSDTHTKPTQEMRKAMAMAEVGDSLIDEDPTVNLLQERAAALVGKEAALFVPSGTMANLIAIMVYCNIRGSEVIAGDLSHTFLFEQGGASQIGGVQATTIKNNEDGTFCLKELREKINTTLCILAPTTQLIVVENTHNACGGKVVPLEWLDELCEIAKEHEVSVHMDGARLMNAAVYLNVPPSRIVQNCDSVCFCLSKGLACPIGSLLCGSKSFVGMAKRIRKALGGSMRQVGIVAAAGLVALDKMVSRLSIDHEHIYQIAKAIDSVKSDIAKVDLKSVQTNILRIDLDTTRVSVADFMKRLAIVKNSDTVKVIVKSTSLAKNTVRLVTHADVSPKDVKAGIEKIRLVIAEFDAKCNNCGRII